MENTVKSLKTALNSKIIEVLDKKKMIASFEGYQSDRIMNLRAHNEKLEEDREKLLTDPNYREQVFTKRFEKALENIEKEIKINARKQGMNKIDLIDSAIRKYIKEVDPKANVWDTLDKYSGGKRDQIEKYFSERFDQAKQRSISRSPKR